MRALLACALACATLALLAGACSAAPAADVSPPDRSPDIEGAVTGVTRYVPRTDGCTIPDTNEEDPDQPVSSDDPPPCSEPRTEAAGGVLVEEESGGCGIDFAVGEQTSILRRTEDGFAEAAIGDLERGRRVEVWASGPIAESCPGQAGAGVIVLR